MTIKLLTSFNSTVFLQLSNQCKDLDYQPGDHLVVAPRNDPDMVQRFTRRVKNCPRFTSVSQLQVQGHDKNWEPYKGIPPCSFETLLSHLIDLTSPPSQSTLQLLSLEATDRKETQRLQSLAQVRTSTFTQNRWATVIQSNVSGLRRVSRMGVKKLPQHRRSFGGFLDDRGGRGVTDRDSSSNATPLLQYFFVWIGFPQRSSRDCQSGSLCSSRRIGPHPSRTVYLVPGEFESRGKGDVFHSAHSVIPSTALSNKTSDLDRFRKWNRTFQVLLLINHSEILSIQHESNCLEDSGSKDVTTKECLQTTDFSRKYRVFWIGNVGNKVHLIV